MDTYLKTLQAPSDDFITNLTTVLDINPLLFCRAVSSTLNKMSADAEKTFNPYIQILIDIQIRPAFAAQIVNRQCTVLVPEQLQHQPFENELHAVVSLYQEHFNTRMSKLSLTNHIKGFQYQRRHNYSMFFSADFVLTSVAFKQAVMRKKMFGDRVMEMLV